MLYTDGLRVRRSAPSGAPAADRAAAIGIEPHLTRALDRTGVGHWPVFDLGRRAARDLECAMMRPGDSVTIRSNELGSTSSKVLA